MTASFIRNSLLSLSLIAGTLAMPASANLIFSQTITQTGTGLGAVPTLVTVQDPPVGGGGNGTESGCISFGGGFNCFAGLEGGDNQAINSTRTAADLPGITSASQLALVVNLNEPDDQALLTGLYLSLFDSSGNLLHAATITQNRLLEAATGIGGAGSVFVLDPVQQTLVDQLCPDVTQCVFGAGVQFDAGTTAGGIETVFLSFTTGVPLAEPATLALFSFALAGLAGLRRKLT